MVIGPLVIPLPRLFFMLGIAVGMLASWIVERRSGTSIEKPLWWSLVVGLLVARGAYVLAHVNAFAAKPWMALYLWQGGYMPIVGALAALAVLMFAARRRGHAWQHLCVPFVAAVALWGGLSWVTQALQQATTKPLPAMTLQTLGGDSVQLTAFKGQPVVINLWATWCPPCRREMPMLAAAQEARPQVHFLFVNQAESRATIRNYLATQNLNLDNVLLDSSRDVTRHFAVRGLPTTLFFNAKGMLVDSHLGMLTRPVLGDYLAGLQARQQ